jgi:hypothetical protein
LKRLETNVMVYRSLGQFEASGRLARVTLQTFETELAEVNNELWFAAGREFPPVSSD